MTGDPPKVGQATDPPIQLQYRSRYARRPDPAEERGKRIKLTAAAIGIVALVLVSAVWNPPTKGHHTFTTASDYRADRESGCTNSGKGCHGSETSYADFNVYHKDVKCASCHDYQGAGCIPCHKPNQHDCPVCHDGTMKNAPDTVRLTDSYPNGHYRETTHTAMGTDMDRTVRTASDGKAKAACSQCHSRDLKTAHTAVQPVADSPYGLDVGCGECHNDVRASGLAEVLSDWKTRRCEDCHKIGTSAPMHSAKVVGAADATSTLGCGSSGAGCHEGDLHSIHADTPKDCSGSAADGEPGCHSDAHEAAKPTATSCGGDGKTTCHRVYDSTDYLHENGASLHSPENAAQASDTSYKGIACGRCHYAAPDGTSLDKEHALASSAKSTVTDDRCRNCHNDKASQDAIGSGWTERSTAEACSACHGKNGLDAPHTADASTVHTAKSAGCSDTGAGCHPTDDLSQVGTPTTKANIHRDCLRCHDRTESDGNVAYDPSKKTCGSGRSCHGDYSPSSAIHGDTDGSDSAHHAASSAQGEALLTDDASDVTVSCNSCHSMQLAEEHSRANSSIASGSGTVCARCHDADGTTASAVKANWPGRKTAEACATCHTGAKRAIHAEVGTAHVGVELGLDGKADVGSCEGSGCHASADLRVLHRRLGCTVPGCHAKTGNLLGDQIVGCGGIDSRTACHAGYSATTGHEKTSLAHAPTELDTKGDLAPGFCMKSGCHPAEDLSRLHRSAGCGISGCHAAGTDPTARSCGGVDSGTSCHTGFSATEHFVSHDASLTGSVNGVTYRSGENAGCFGCHRSDLSEEHSSALIDGSMDAVAAGPCRVCHYNADDPGSGEYADSTAVKAAIADHDLRCTSCHKSGNALDGDAAIASPHKALSSESSLPAGAVWADPFSEWKAAFDAPTGGGHNVLSASVVGATRDKDFPVTSFELGGKTYAWALPPNTGDTTWLRGGATTTGEIQQMKVTCADCHVLPDDMKGPQGASVRVYIDPAYSQTEYANPDRKKLASQFSAKGTDRVICFKCHTLNRGSVEGTDAPGGDPVHSQHATHAKFPSYSPVRYGERCTDCHVRIPHAWRRPRLLIRTVGGDGAKTDEFPYVDAQSDGLMGVVLGDFDSTGDLGPASCVTGGCHGRHDETTHPMPSDIPTATYWP